MKNLPKVKKIVIVLLIISVIITLFSMFQGGIGIFVAYFYEWDIATECILPSAITLVGLAQCVNLSIILYILNVLDKNLMPLY